MNRDLIAIKSRLLLDLQEAKARSAARDILDFASRAAALEGRIANEYIAEGRIRDAVVNLISEASCLSDADRPIEQRRVLETALTLTSAGGEYQWISSALSAMGNLHPNPAESFTNSGADIRQNQSLRRPQREAYEAAHSYFNSDRANHAIIQLPVGCGKTGTIAILPYEVANGRVLVVAPNKIIRDNLRNNLDSSRPDAFVRKANVLGSRSRATCAVLDENANIRDCDEAAILVTNIQQLASGGSRKWLDKMAPDFFDLIILDEAHHNVAPTWKQSLEHFPKARIASFTATPFRADGQKVDGERIYRFPIVDAIREGYIKDLASHRIEPEEISFTYRGETSRHSLDEVTRLKEKDWFSKGVALSPECNKGIVDHSIACMMELREGSSMSHAIVAAACSIDHARAIRAMYVERNLRAEVIHSDLAEFEQERILTSLRKGELDAIVQVQMLGEGADFPNLSVAAIFRPYRHLVPYVQFVGRVMRVIKQGAAGDPDNRGYVVSHVGLNVDRWWRELKDLDDTDQEFFQELAESDRVFLLGSASPGSALPSQRRLFMPEMVVIEEVITKFVKDRFLPEDVSAMMDDLLSTLRLRGIDLEALGMSRETLEERMLTSYSSQPVSAPVQPLPVQPQQARLAARTRLDERVRSASKQLLNELQLTVVGRDLVRLFPKLGAQNNLTAAIILLNLQVQQSLSLGDSERDIATTEQLISIHDGIDKIIDKVAEKVRFAREK